MDDSYLALLVSAGLCAVVVAVMVGASWLLGKRSPNRAKSAVFEAGNRAVGEVKSHRFPVKFYLTAILFIVFDVEVVFMYPWAVTFKELSRTDLALGLGGMLSFLGIVFVGYLYAVKKRAFDWKS